MPKNEPTTCQKPALVDGAEGLPRPVRRTLQEIGDMMADDEDKTDDE